MNPAPEGKPTNPEVGAESAGSIESISPSPLVEDVEEAAKQDTAEVEKTPEEMHVVDKRTPREEERVEDILEDAQTLTKDADKEEEEAIGKMEEIHSIV